MSLRVTNAEVVFAAKNKFENHLLTKTWLLNFVMNLSEMVEKNFAGGFSFILMFYVAQGTILVWQVAELKIEVTEVKGDIKLINHDIEVIKTNHLTHIQKSINNINKVLWTVGIMIFAELVILLRHFILG